MELRFKHQKYQLEAANAVCDVFNGQPCRTSSYQIDKGSDKNNYPIFQEEQNEYIGVKNYKIILSENQVLENIQRIQNNYNLKRSEKLEGLYNITIEMETGTGKTYTYIKTMYELNRKYGWTKFIIVVPSIAIREGVFSSFKITEKHFASEYGSKIKFFIYNSTNLNAINDFASNDKINVMIINTQAFNASGKDARRIDMELDSFRSRKPIDVIAATNPILIIDEPQSVEGEKTKVGLKKFNALMTIRYSATHKSMFNMVYRLDAIEAYNKKLVKKIEVKSVTESGSSSTDGYLYIQKINLSAQDPTVTIEFDYKGKNSILKKVKTFAKGDNLYSYSNELEQYKNNYIVSNIDGMTNCVQFVNGISIHVGEIYGSNNDIQTRRIQIQETIKSHLMKEQELFNKNIKVLSLFFIDKVEKYRIYDNNNNQIAGEYANMFEEEYSKQIEGLKSSCNNNSYLTYLNKINSATTHAGYFSVDKKSNKFIDSKVMRSEQESNDVDAYDLIMKDKERLLDLDEPVRFIFSHSALKEGWDNPNVFQICTLKKTNAHDRKRQEIGRGLRLCVNQDGDRMDIDALGELVHDINLLTVIANESYSEFTTALQKETAEIVADRPREVNELLFENKKVKNATGDNELIIDSKNATKIYHSMIKNDYIDTNNKLTEKYYEDKKNDQIIIPEEFHSYKEDILNIIASIYDPKINLPVDANSSKIKVEINKNNFDKKEFHELWSKINSKSAYVVKFDSKELIDKSVKAINDQLSVAKIYHVIATGEMQKIDSKEQLIEGTAFDSPKTDHQVNEAITINSDIKYDLIGKIADGTKLTRGSIVEIIKKIDKDKFNSFKYNPEDFILKTCKLINDQKATIIIEHISYNKTDEVFSMDIFTLAKDKNELKPNSTIPTTKKHLYNFLQYESDVEKKMAEKLDKSEKVSVYVKLPKGFYIDTPVGKYNPDWAIVFNEVDIKHIYFIAETKGSLSSLELKLIEKAKITCAKKHFKSITDEKVEYDVVNSFEELLNKVLKVNTINHLEKNNV